MSQVDRGFNWRITPTTAAAKLITEISEAEGRSISSCVQRLVSESVDRRALDAAIARAGLTDAVKILEAAAIARNAATVIDPAILADIEPRPYRKSA
jgi:hypothetical protein